MLTFYGGTLGLLTIPQEINGKNVIEQDKKCGWNIPSSVVEAKHLPIYSTLLTGTSSSMTQSRHR